MRFHAAWLVVALAAGCAPRARPYRSAAPLLGSAALPPPPLGGSIDRTPRSVGNRAPSPPYAATARPIRVTPAPTIHEASASASAAAAIRAEPSAQPAAWSLLPARHRGTPAQPLLHSPTDLRELVGRRDAREPVTAALDWARELGVSTDVTTGSELIAWAEHARRTTTTPGPGDLLVFDRVEGAPADLVAVVVARDEREVTEFVYLGGGVIRRGFVDRERPAVRRDVSGRVVNTYLRTGKKWPPRGTHYLAGELLAAVIRARRD